MSYIKIKIEGEIEASPVACKFEDFKENVLKTIMANACNYIGEVKIEEVKDEKK